MRKEEITHLNNASQPNILVDDDGHARIADFGITSIIAEVGLPQTTSYHPQGTPRWMAPEMSDGTTRRSKPTDVFALALVAWEVRQSALASQHHC